MWPTCPVLYVETEFYRDGCANRITPRGAAEPENTMREQKQVVPPVLDRQQFEFYAGQALPVHPPFHHHS